jgi:plastocyanin
MKRKNIIGIIIIILLIISVYFLIPSSDNSSSLNSSTGNSQTPPQIPTPGNSQTPPSLTTSNIIEMSTSGFIPSTLTIQSGEKVIFKAIDTSNRWPASAMHPTHKVYPNSDIQKCGTSEELIIFDSCKGISEGQTYEFTFNEIGTWNFHDHLQPSKFGKIIVV